ncbi:MAG: glycosyltransferase family 4 protein [Planctomycetota bacterium]
MHVCFLNFVIEQYSPQTGGAISTVVMQQARELIDRGHRVTVLSPLNGAPAYDIGDVLPVETASRESLSFVQRRVSDLNRKINRWDWHFYEVYLRSALDQLGRLDEAPDAILIQNDWHAARHVRRICPDAMITVHLHNELFTNQSAAGFAASIDATDRFLMVSDHIRGWTLNRHPIPAEKAVVINNGVDTRIFSPREAYDASRRHVRTLFVGRLDPNKGPDLLAQAVLTLQGEGHDVSLTLAGSKWFGDIDQRLGQGPDAYYDRLMHSVRQAGGEALGYVPRPDIAEVIRECDVMAVLSRSEDPNPLTCLEGMASGCAMLGAQRGGIPDAFGPAGLIVDPDRPTEIADALRSLVADPDELARQKNLSLARAAERTWAWHVDRLEEEVLHACQPA